MVVPVIGVRYIVLWGVEMYPFHCLECPYKCFSDVVRESSSREDDDLDEDVDEVDDEDVDEDVDEVFPSARTADDLPAADPLSVALFARIFALKRIVACLNAGVDVGRDCPQLREF